MYQQVFQQVSDPPCTVEGLGVVTPQLQVSPSRGGGPDPPATSVTLWRGLVGMGFLMGATLAQAMVTIEVTSCEPEVV